MSTNKSFSYFRTLYLSDIQQLNSRKSLVTNWPKNLTLFYVLFWFLEGVSLCRVLILSFLISSSNSEKLTIYLHYDRILAAFYKMGVQESTVYQAGCLMLLSAALAHAQIYLRPNPTVWTMLDQLLLSGFNSIELQIRESLKFRNFTRHPLVALGSGFQIVKQLWNGENNLINLLVPRSADSHFRELTAQNRAHLLLLWLTLEVGAHFLIFIGES